MIGSSSRMSRGANQQEKDLFREFRRLPHKIRALGDEQSKEGATRRVGREPGEGPREGQDEPEDAEIRLQRADGKGVGLHVQPVRTDRPGQADDAGELRGFQGEIRRGRAEGGRQRRVVREPVQAPVHAERADDRQRPGALQSAQRVRFQDVCGLPV